MSQSELLARLEAAALRAASIGADGSPLAVAVERLECEVEAARLRMANLERRATLALAALAELDGQAPEPAAPAPVEETGEASQVNPNAHRAPAVPVADSAACEPTAPVVIDSATSEPLDPAPARTARKPRHRKPAPEEVQTARCAPVGETDLPSYWPLAVGPIGAPRAPTRKELTQ